jgi:hypothetical protein
MKKGRQRTELSIDRMNDTSLPVNITRKCRQKHYMNEISAVESKCQLV